MMKIKDLILEENIKNVLTEVLLANDTTALTRYVKALTLNPLSNNEANVSNVDNASYIIAVAFQKYSQIQEKIKDSEALLTAKQSLKSTSNQGSTNSQKSNQQAIITNQQYLQNQVKVSSDWNNTKFMDQANEANNQQTGSVEVEGKVDTTNSQDNNFKAAEITYKSQLQALRVYQANLWKRSIDNVLLELSNPLDFVENEVKKPWFLTW